MNGWALRSGPLFGTWYYDFMTAWKADVRKGGQLGCIDAAIEDGLDALCYLSSAYAHPVGLHVFPVLKPTVQIFREHHAMGEIRTGDSPQAEYVLDALQAFWQLKRPLRPRGSAWKKEHLVVPVTFGATLNPILEELLVRRGEIFVSHARSALETLRGHAPPWLRDAVPPTLLALTEIQAFVDAGSPPAFAHPTVWLAKMGPMLGVGLKDMASDPWEAAAKATDWPEAKEALQGLLATTPTSIVDLERFTSRIPGPRRAGLAP